MKIWSLKASADSSTLEVTLYGVIGAEWFSDSTDKLISDGLRAHPSATRINVHINSEGGDMFAGIAIANMLRGHGAEIVCYVEGLAASAASIVAIAGRTVMGRGAMMMVHNPWALVAGNADELRATADVLDKAQSALVEIYSAKTGKDADELRAMLDAETWFTAAEAMAHGFADEIDEAPVAVEARGSDVLVNAALFPRDRVPAQFLAMIASAPSVEATAQPVALTRETIAARAPEIVAALVAEGHTAGVAAERARLQSIDELAMAGHADLVETAKYGAEPMTAEALAVAVLKASKKAGIDLLEGRRRESVAALVTAQSPQQADAATEQRAVDELLSRANARRSGGNIR